MARATRIRATGMTLNVVESSWLPRSGGSETAASEVIIAVHRTATPRGRARSPDQPSAVHPSAVLPEPLVEGARPVERDPIELGQFRGVQPPPQGARVVLGLLSALGARNRDDSLGDDPGEGDLARGAVAVGCTDAPQDIHHLVHFGHRMGREVTAARRRIGGGVLAGQPTLANG